MSTPVPVAQPVAPPKQSLWQILRGEPLRIIVAVLIAAEVTILNFLPGIKASAVSQTVIGLVTALLGELARAGVSPKWKVPEVGSTLTNLLGLFQRLEASLPDQAGAAGRIADSVIQSLQDVLSGFQQTGNQPPAGGPDPMVTAAAVFGTSGSAPAPVGAPVAHTTPRPEAPETDETPMPGPDDLYLSYMEEKPGEDGAGGRLGRHIEHDPKSGDFPVRATPSAVSVLWTRRVAPFDQGDIGSCTGNAAAGVAGTDNSTRAGRLSVIVTPDKTQGFTLSGEVPVDEALAIALYTLNTHLDRVPGTYPKQDTGSSGLAAAKALIKVGMASGTYRHGFSVSALISGLQKGPMMIGIPWYSGFDRPNTRTGLVTLSGQVRGGHELEVIGWDKSTGHFILPQSWGEDWTHYVPSGCAGKGGYFQMTTPDMTRVLAEQGDSTFVLAD